MAGEEEMGQTNAPGAWETPTPGAFHQSVPSNQQLVLVMAPFESITRSQ
jgi:hypothetical protein